MSRQATLALVNLVSRGKPLKEAVAELRSKGKAAYEDESTPNGDLIETDEEVAPEQPEGGDEGSDGGDPPAGDQTGADGAENGQDGDDKTGAGDDKTGNSSSEGEGEGEGEADLNPDAPLEIPANWEEMEWKLRLKLAKNVAARMGIADPADVKSSEDVATVMTGAIATLKAKA